MNTQDLLLLESPLLGTYPNMLAHLRSGICSKDISVFAVVNDRNV